MKISTEKPKCWDRLEAEFGVSWDKGVIVTYGGVIHCKSGILAPDYLVHELVHVKQQEGWEPDEYLERYITDADFRRDSEEEAFAMQWRFLKVTTRSLDDLWRIRNNLRKKMIHNYGDIFTELEANRILNILA